MLASAAQVIKNRMTQPPGTGCGPRSAKGSVWRPFNRASISALLITSGTETVCAVALLCCCGFCGSRGCCGKEVSPARAEKALIHRQNSWTQPAPLDSRVSGAKCQSFEDRQRGWESKAPSRVASYKKSGRKCIVHGQICELSKAWRTARHQNQGAKCKLQNYSEFRFIFSA